LGHSEATYDFPIHNIPPGYPAGLLARFFRRVTKIRFSMPKTTDALLPAPTTSFLPQYVRPDRKLGVVLLGLGKYSQDQLGPALQQSKFCNLVGVITDDPAKAHDWMQRYDLPPQNCYDYQTFGAVANNPHVDLIYVVTPNATHAGYVVQAAEAGKHVICEKPLGISVRDCETMIAACEKAGVQLAVGYRLHVDPVHRELARLGREKIFGPVKYLELSQGYRPDEGDTTRLDGSLAGGGPLLDVGITASTPPATSVVRNRWSSRRSASTPTPVNFNKAWKRPCSGNCASPAEHWRVAPPPTSTPSGGCTS